MPKYKGVSIEFANGETFIVPPLTLGAVEQLQDRLLAFKGGIDKDSISFIIEATTTALQRNYPEITQEHVKNELIDLGNMEEVIGAVLDVSGIKRKQQGQEQPVGEPAAGV